MFEPCNLAKKSRETRGRSYIQEPRADNNELYVSTCTTQTLVAPRDMQRMAKKGPKSNSQARLPRCLLSPC